MAGKISLKTILIIFSFVIILILSACVEPVDIKAFIENPKVQGIIEAKKTPPPSVRIDKGSDNYDDLDPGDGSISGLIPGKYYRLEEYDEEKVFKRNLFIKADGNPSQSLGGIDCLAGTEIVNLINFFTYKVKSTQPFDPDGVGTYEYFVFGDNNRADNVATVLQDEETLITTATVSFNETGDYYLNIAPVIDVNSKYEIMMIPAPSDWNSSSRMSAFYNNGLVTNLPNIGTSYTKYNTKLIGIYQYRSNISSIRTGNVDLSGKSIIKLPDKSTAQSDYVFIKYDNDENITNFTFLRVEIKQAIIADDFTIGNLEQEYGSVTAVTITPKEGKSTGVITIYYDGSTTLPTALGNYAVTFDVAATTGFAAATGLTAGTLTISKGNPKAGDFNISDNFTQKVSNITPITATAKSGKSTGAVKVYYAGANGTVYAKSETLPTVVGTYDVTFDVAADANWNAASGLIAGTLTIKTTYKIVISAAIGFSPEYTPIITAVTDPVTLSQTDSSFNITLTLTNAGGYDDFKWYNGDDSSHSPLPGSGALTSIVLTYNKSADYDWWQIGDHYIYLEIKDTSNVLPPQSGVIIITVGP
jgi:hypothetical protein